MPLVVQMHGSPGSGKSTLARALAPLIDAIALDKDVFKAALLDAGIEERAAASGAYETYFALARSLVAQGRPVILDNPVHWPTVERHWLDLTERAGSPAILIECRCDNDEELRRRLATRPALSSQPREPLDLLRHPGSAPTQFQPRLVLDMMRPLPEVTAEAEAYIRSLTQDASVNAVAEGAR